LFGQSLVESGEIDSFASTSLGGRGYAAYEALPREEFPFSTGVRVINIAHPVFAVNANLPLFSNFF
jgi:hypothetical protein